jgi:signal transduction histidine kinase
MSSGTDPIRPPSVNAGDAGIRELMAVREIAQALLTSTQPVQVYQLALERVSPLVGATFACVFLRDADTDLMRVAAAHNWPDRYARFLGEMRVRVGSGPSGIAASERRAVEVPDVFDDASLDDWREVATELGFRSLVALPLQCADRVLGTVTFYFARTLTTGADATGLLRVVADQMAAAAEKARTMDDLARANDALQHSNAELERQYVAVLEARRLQDEFLSNVSHELRTPLTAVLGYLALMEEGLAGPITDEQQHTLTQVKESSDHLLELIGDLLELTSLKRGELVMQATEFDPWDAVRDALATTNGRREAVELVMERDVHLPKMTSDRRRVTRLLCALFSNAFKFTEQGEVRVAVAAAGERVRFEVSDTGVGISEDAQRFVFDEFRQEDGSATRRYGGSGLGLAIARRLAQLLGGEIGMSSERGKGSSFRVELPQVLSRP